MLRASVNIIEVGEEPRMNRFNISTINEETSNQQDLRGEEEEIIECIPMENIKRKRLIKRITNGFAFMALLDALGSFPLIILCLRADHFSDIPALFGCVQILCFLFLSFFSGWMLLRSTTFEDRIDAIGAWVVVHFIYLIVNVCFVYFQGREDPYVLWETSIILTVLMAWKTFFSLLEIVSCVYCFYISHRPVEYYKIPIKRTRHPLFLDHEPSQHHTIQSTNQHNTLQSTVDQTNNGYETSTITRTTNPNDQLSDQLRRPISVISKDITPLHKDSARYSSYLSLAQNSDTRFVRNPAFESELSLDYANNYSPYDQMIFANRSRLSYAERLVDTAEHRPYLHNGNMSNRNSYVFSDGTEGSQYENVVNEFQSKRNKVTNRTSTHF